MTIFAFKTKCIYMSINFIYYFKQYIIFTINQLMFEDFITKNISRRLYMQSKEIYVRPY